VNTFGNVKSVKRDIFMPKYLDKVKSTDAYTVRVLAKYVIRGFEIDNLEVLYDEFVNFVARFGPLDSSFTKAKASLFDKDNYLLPWFHGALSREEAEKRLGTTEAGQYLVRFSEKFLTKLTIMYTSTVHGAFHVKNILVHNTEKGYTLHDGEKDPEGSTDPKYFANLVDLISSFNTKLAKPVPSPILDYIRSHDQPGSKAPGYTVPDLTKVGRYQAFPDGTPKTPASPTDKPKGDNYQTFSHERKPSTGGHEPGTKHHADYSKFGAKDKDHLSVK